MTVWWQKHWSTLSVTCHSWQRVTHSTATIRCSWRTQSRAWSLSRTLRVRGAVEQIRGCTDLRTTSSAAGRLCAGGVQWRARV